MLRCLFVLFVCLCSAIAQDEARLVGELRQAFRPSKSKPVSIEQRTAALTAVADLDSQRVAEALVDAWVQVEDEVAALDAARLAAEAEIAELRHGQEGSDHVTLPQPKFDRLKALQAQVQQQRQDAEARRDLLQALTNRTQQLQRPDALLFLLQKVCGNKKLPLPIKLAAARAIGGAATKVVDELAAALQRAQKPEDQLALLDAMALAGDAAKPHATPVLALLHSKEEAVRERAALALAKIAVPEAIAPMIELLGDSSGQTRLRIAAALEVLTGQQFGINQGAWEGWYQAEGNQIVNDRQLGKGTPSHRKDTDKNYYFGIPQDQSNAILYVIDCSGSMKKEIELKLGTGTVSAGSDKTTRLEGCKKELIRALGLLQPRQKFDVLWYNDVPHLWEPQMQAATKDNVARAQAMVAALQAASSTNIYDSLQLGFGLVGRGTHDKYYGVELDTIFLLTDGSPTKPDGKLDSTDKILQGVQQWNPLHRVTIHTIGIGGELNRPFLEDLARENGGEFKQF